MSDLTLIFSRMLGNLIAVSLGEANKGMCFKLNVQNVTVL